MDDTAEQDDLTEFEVIEVESIKAVPQGANGFPHLIMKGIAAGPAQKAVVDGKIDQKPDVGLGKQILDLLGQAMGNESDEVSAGAYGETADVSLLARAADMVSRWCAGEEGGCGCCGMCTAPGCGCCMGCRPGMSDWDGAVMASADGTLADGYTVTIGGQEVDPATVTVKAKLSSAAENDLPDSAFAYIEDGGKKDSEGKTTPRSKRHFPVHDKTHAQNALSRLSSSPFADKAKAKVHAAAKKFGIHVDGDAGKSAVAEGETTVDTGTSEGLTKSDLEAVVTKAVEPLKAELETLRAFKAKVEKTAIPGGPVLSANARPMGAQTAEADDLAAKAALMRAKADAATSPSDAAGYRQYARELDEQAAKTTQA